MNRTKKSLTILAAITLSTLLVFNIVTTTMITSVSAEPVEEGYEIKERSYNDLPSSLPPPERGSDGYSSPMTNDYDDNSPELSMMKERGEYNNPSDRFGGYYDHYESEFYLDQYADGNPYGNDDSPYENDSPHEMG